MKKISKKIIVLLLLSSAQTFAQTPEQSSELDRINRSIIKSEAEIAEIQAKRNVLNFFADRFEYIHQTNARCLDIFNQISTYAENLKKPLLLSEKYNSSDQAYAALEVLSSLIIRENIILDEILKLQQEYELQKGNLKNTERFLYVNQGWVTVRFPKPNEVTDGATYFSSLWREYQNIIQKDGEKFKYYISKCGGSKFDFRPQIQQRKNAYDGIYNLLMNFYLKKFEEEYANNILSKYKPTVNTRIMLAVTEALNSMDRSYRDAIMLDHDYFKAILTINSYENVAAIILARAVPRESNETIRKEAQAEIQRRLVSAQNYKKTIEKEKPSYWLNKKYQKIKTQISSGQIQCVSGCKKNLDQAEALISASKIVEDVIVDSIYATLGYQALDFIK